MKEAEKVKDPISTEILAKPKKRRLLKIIGIVVLVLILVFASTLFFIDNIIASGIRYGGTAALGVKVDVSSVRLRLLHGSLEMKGLTVENPSGSSAQYAFKMPEFFAQLEPMSVLSDKIIISDIVITGMHINYEPMLKGGSNLQLLLENIKKGEKGKKPKPAKDKPTKTDEQKSKPSKKIIIKHLLTKGGEINMTLLGRSSVIPMPAVELNDIGEGGDVAVPEAIGMFLSELISSVINNSSNILKDIGTDPVGTVEDAVKNIGELLKKSK